MKTDQNSGVSLNRIYKTWWPLAASWFMMSLEGPLISAIIARLVNPTISLAAFGGIINPLALVIEAPVVMLLSASTVLSKDYASFTKLRKAMLIMGGSLTVLHFLVAFTPLYYFVVNNILGVPEELVAPARTGMMIMLPWTWSIGYRRFNQGVMIRFGHSDGVMQCTMVRLSTIILVLFGGYFIGTIPGIIVATIAEAAGVTFEAIFSGLRVRRIVQDDVKSVPVSDPFSWREFAAFYAPLVLTSLLQFLGNPIGSAALSRMPNAIDSLATWGVILNLVFLLRSIGMGYNEVVVALISEKGSFMNLKNFSHMLTAFLTIVVLVIFLTPISRLWFEQVTGLSGELSELARSSLVYVLAVPPLSVYQSWFQGSILYSRKTKSITESVILYLVVFVFVLIAGVIWGKATGLYVGAAAFGLANVAQTFWLFIRSRDILAQIHQRDMLKE
ncbi:MAG: hypothetical protein LLG42_14635 [Chloroflexi bacterium]|nr:hypothetical protein [Chloroflexota bacterium]